jgi:hypothetical protein
MFDEASVFIVWPWENLFESVTKSFAVNRVGLAAWCDVFTLDLF